jgi:hypothetical protein
MYNWILLRRKWIFPFFSNFELHVSLMILALIYFFAGNVTFTIAGFSVGLFDAYVAISSLLSFGELLFSAGKLLRELH